MNETTWNQLRTNRQQDVTITNVNNLLLTKKDLVNNAPHVNNFTAPRFLTNASETSTNSRTNFTSITRTIRSTWTISRRHGTTSTWNKLVGIDVPPHGYKTSLSTRNEMTIPTSHNCSGIRRSSLWRRFVRHYLAASCWPLTDRDGNTTLLWISDVFVCYPFLFCFCTLGR